MGEQVAPVELSAAGWERVDKEEQQFMEALAAELPPGDAVQVCHRRLRVMYEAHYDCWLLQATDFQATDTPMRVFLILCT
jgi:hypothetical protein